MTTVREKQLDVIVLTFNEERNLPFCLAALRGLPARVFVVDSGSADRTVEIAREYGCAVYDHSFLTHSEQWRWALDNLPLGGDWLLAIDADQLLTPELCASVARLVQTAGMDVKGAYLCRRQIFRGKWIRFGGYYPKYLLKLFRREVVSLSDDLVDHHFIVSGRTVKLEGDILEANRNEDEIAAWIGKHNRYAQLQAQEEMALIGRDWRGRLTGTPDERVLALKWLWRRLPLYVRPFGYFIYRYIFRLGFLDGKQGFIFHFLQAFWYRLLVDINIDEKRVALKSRAVG